MDTCNNLVIETLHNTNTAKDKKQKKTSLNKNGVSQQNTKIAAVVIATYKIATILGDRNRC